MMGSHADTVNLTMAATVAIVPRMDAKKVKRLRLRLKLTQAQFAKKLGVSETAVTRWESTSPDSHRQPNGSARVLLEALAKEPAP